MADAVEMLSDHFSKAELACKHCGVCVVDAKLLSGLETLRTLAGKAVIVHDAYRCPEHNAAVGGAPRSSHPNGQAADVHIAGLSIRQMYQLALGVPEFAAGGIGIYAEGFIHVDVRGYVARWARMKKEHDSAGRYYPINDLLEVGAIVDRPVLNSKGCA
jgi:uncharacterized protein YcbK (DUF882 family)